MRSGELLFRRRNETKHKKKNENKHCHFYLFFKTAKINEKQGTPLLTEKHPFINDAENANLNMRWPLQ
jgi:hypothetical protein